MDTSRLPSYRDEVAREQTSTMPHRAAEATLQQAAELAGMSYSAT